MAHRVAARRYFVCKSVIDIVLAWLTLLLLLPLFVTLMAGVRFSSPGPIFYNTLRHGRNGRSFPMYKFRSMRVRTIEAERREQERVAEAGILEKQMDDPRVTRFGQFIRKTSLDELPQIFNIALGQMSFVGPRPVMPAMTAPFPNFERARCLVKPGITGLWQIRDRHRSTHVVFMREHDLEYVDTASWMVDIKTILLTFPRVALRQGAY